MEEPYAKSIIKVNVGSKFKVKDEIIFKSYHGHTLMIVTSFNTVDQIRKEKIHLELKLEDLKTLKTAIEAEIKLFTPRK